MSITLGKFLPGEKELCLDTPSLDVQVVLNKEDFYDIGFNACLTEASKVEIGLDRTELICAFGNYFQNNMDTDLGDGDVQIALADFLLAEESELIIRKEGK